jgi:hypothetical protein
LSELSQDAAEELEQGKPQAQAVSPPSPVEDQRALFAEMATVRMNAAHLSDLSQSYTPLIWKKIKVPYTATVNVRRTKKRPSKSSPRQRAKAKQG